MSGAVGPSWTYDPKIEVPAGSKWMGDWWARVYTPEQQKRLGVDEFGNFKLKELDRPTVNCFAFICKRKVIQNLI